MYGYDPRAAGAACDSCPLRDKPKVPPSGTLDAKLVIVLDAPSFHDEKKGKLAVGPSGVMLDDLLYHAGLKRSEVWLTAATLCRPETPTETGAKRYDQKVYAAWLRKENAERKKRGEPEIQSPMGCCQMRLFGELATAEREALRRGQPNGAVVVTMGPVALKSVADKDGVLTWRGSPLPLAYFNQEDA
jgi:Uracil DNA glycosylase superfamily